MCLGIPGQVVEMLDAERWRAIVDVDGVRREISVALLAGSGGGEAERPVDVGDWVLIHVGFALARLDEEEAALTLDALRELGAAYDDELAGLGGSTDRRGGT